MLHPRSWVLGRDAAYSERFLISGLVRGFLVVGTNVATVIFVRDHEFCTVVAGNAFLKIAKEQVNQQGIFRGPVVWDGHFQHDYFLKWVVLTMFWALTADLFAEPAHALWLLCSDRSRLRFERSRRCAPGGQPATPHTRRWGTLHSIHQRVCWAYVDGVERITLDFQAYIGAQDVQDKITIKGSPSFDVVVNDGVQGDDATAAMIVNVVPKVIDAGAGLKTMKDIAMAVAVS